MIKVLIDPGHALGNNNKGPTGYYEYQGVWKISNYLKEILTAKGVQVDFTRNWNEDPDLYDRGQKAVGYDLFISEHTNASNGAARGVECFYDYSKVNDEEFAERIASKVAVVMGNTNRGAKTRIYTDDGEIYNYYGVIRGAASTDCKHILLIESGYHDNTQDEAFLKKDANLEKIAAAQAEVIYEILGIVESEETEMRYKNIREMPEWMQVYVKDWVDKGLIKGNTTGELNFSEDMIRTLIISERISNFNK